MGHSFKKFLNKNELNKICNLILDNNVDDEDVELLVSKLNTSKNIVKEILKRLQSRHKIVKFPIINNNDKKFCTAHIVEIDSPYPLCLKSENDFQEHLKIIQKYTEKSFFVLFDDNFTGSSFMFSIATALVIKKFIPEKFILSGEITENGDIKDVDFLEEKLQFCKDNKKILITSKDIKTIKELQYWIELEKVPIPLLFIINKNKDEALNSMEKAIKTSYEYFSIKNLKLFYDIAQDDIISFYEKELPSDPEEWKTYLHDSFEKIKKLMNKFPSNKIELHISGTISSIMILIGCKLESFRKPLVIYNYQNNEYKKIIDLSNNKSKEKIKEIIQDNYSKIKVSHNVNSRIDEVAIGIYLASKKPFSDIETYLKENKINIPLIKIECKDQQGNITEDWITYLQEIHSEINKIKDEYYVKRFHLFLSIPVPIAFGLGITLGDFIPFTIYNINKKGENRYFKIGCLEDF